MNMNAAIHELLACKPTDEIVTCASEDYYNNLKPNFSEVTDIIRESNKIIILYE